MDLGVSEATVKLPTHRSTGHCPVGECLSRVDIAGEGHVIDRALAVIIILLEEDFHIGLRQVDADAGEALERWCGV